MDETAALQLGGAVLLIVVVLVLEVFRVRCIRREAASSSDAAGPGLASGGYRSTVCESKDCVRCSKNKEILMNALTRLSFHTSGSKISGLLDSDGLTSSINNEILAVSSDIKTSLRKLKDQDNSNSNSNRASSCELEVKGKNSEVSSPLVLKCSGIREQKIWCLDDFPGINLLEKNFTQIYLEFIHLYTSPLSETTELWKTNQTSKGGWEIVMLVDQGRRTRASELCPLTMGFLDQIPYFMRDNMFGNASFSVVHPDTEITAHYGSTNCRIRCHLGLATPADAENCSLWVDGHTLHWEEGKSIFFNDAFLHSVNHRGPADSGARVVLMLDLWHPDISEARRKVLDYAFSS